MDKALYIVRYPNSKEGRDRLKRVLKQLIKEILLYAHDVQHPADCASIAVEKNMESLIPSIAIYCTDDVPMDYSIVRGLSRDHGYDIIQVAIS